MVLLLQLLIHDDTQYYDFYLFICSFFIHTKLVGTCEIIHDDFLQLKNITRHEINGFIPKCS